MNLSPLLIAVDPGAHGSIIVDDGVRLVPLTYSMPATLGDCIDLCENILAGAPNLTSTVVYYEKITGFIPGGGASQMFAFGENVMMVKAVLQTLGCKIIEISPQTWQKALGLGTKVGMVKAPVNGNEASRKRAAQTNARIKKEWKNKLKAEAQRRFPGLRVTLNNADALLLLEYGRKEEARIAAPWTRTENVWLD